MLLSISQWIQRERHVPGVYLWAIIPHLILRRIQAFVEWTDKQQQDDDGEDAAGEEGYYRIVQEGKSAK